MIQQQDQTDPIKFEVHMYHPTAMANAVTPTSWFDTLYVHTPSSIVQRDNPSRLEIAFLLDSGASISVPNYPTYITLTKLLDIRSNHTSDVGPTRNSKTLTVANQTEVPILLDANIILNTTIDENSRYFSVPFAVADIKYNILGTPFFEDNIQNINIQDFTLEYKYQSKTHPNYTKFTTLLSKDYPYFSYIYRINSKTQIRLKPKSSKIAHFPIKIIIIFILQLHHKTTSFLQYLIPILLPNFVQISILLRYLPMTNQIFVQLLFRTLQNMLQHYLQDILDTLKFQLLMKNLNSSKLTTLILYYIMLLILIILILQNHFHKPTILYNMMILQPLLLNSLYIKFI